LRSPIGVFDSGVGGLSVLQALRAELPLERFVYLADSGHAPYGERGDAFVAARTHALTQPLCAAPGIQALVVACNTATAAAIDALRQHHPDLPIVGVEPALKPAAGLTHTGRIGVMATRGTLGSGRFAQLQAAQPAHIEWVLQPCDGLARAIEHRTTDPAARLEVQALCARYTQAMGRFGTGAGEIDTLVLGCTHYVFARDELRALLGPDVRMIDTGEPVARQTRRLLDSSGRLATTGDASGDTADSVRLLTTGDLAALQAAAAQWLGLPPTACARVALPTASID